MTFFSFLVHSFISYFVTKNNYDIILFCLAYFTLVHLPLGNWLCILAFRIYLFVYYLQEITFHILTIRKPLFINWFHVCPFFSSVLFHSEFQNELFLVFHIRLKTNKNLSYLCLRLEKDLVKLVRKTVSLYTFFAVLAIAKRLFSCYNNHNHNQYALFRDMCYIFWYKIQEHNDIMWICSKARLYRT